MKKRSNKCFAETVVQLIVIHVMYVAHLTVMRIKKKNHEWISYLVTFYFKHVVGGRVAHKIVGVEVLFYPPNFVSHPLLSPNFVGTNPCLGGRSNVWIRCNGGVSTYLRHQWMKYKTMWNFEHEIMFNRIPQSALRRKDQMSHKRSVMSNKRNAVMSVIHVIWFQDVSLAQRRRNPTIARRDIYVYIYIHASLHICIYIYMYLDLVVRMHARCHSVDTLCLCSFLCWDIHAYVCMYILLLWRDPCVTISYQTGWNVTKCHACHAKRHDNLLGNLRKGQVLQLPP